jgi:glyoxylase-like metal-dependent hydrolase (beta-lactamase superfamily II)
VEIEQLNDWLWCLRTPAVQAYALHERDGFNLVDTLVAGSAADILDALARIDGCAAREVRLYEIALTHAHDDHRGSVAALAERTGASVVAPALEAGVVEGSDALPPPALREWERPLWKMYGNKTPLTRPVEVNVRVEPGDRLAWERAARVVAAPGHTPGSVAYWFDRERVLVAGDAIAIVHGRPVSGVFNVDPPRAETTLAKLAALDPEVVCVGHGEPIRSAAGATLRAASAIP